MKNLLDIQNLKTYFYMEEQILKAVDDVSFSIRAKEIVAIVGESGCGKSTTALSILKLISPPGKIVGGKINFNDTDLLELGNKQLRKIRGNNISMIFQEPLSCLNPTLTIGNQILEAIFTHKSTPKAQAYRDTIDILKTVGLPDQQRIFNTYPHQLSGGMQQRVMIAMALITKPQLLIADEPTTALDVTIQAQILSLLKTLQRKLNMSILLITHDLSIVAQVAQRVVVMYGGEIVEEADVKQIFACPLHPYTEALLKSVPNLKKEKGKLEVIPGSVPNPAEFPTGCRFHPRCREADRICKKAKPGLFEVEKQHFVRCLKR
ncbi:ABC transporter ATP-binding protein [bacterium]|nr:ABC transporter ATP-binding protein [bacterium]